MVVVIASFYWLASALAPALIPLSPSSNGSLFVIVAVSALLGCISTLIGLLMNAQLMIGRQVLTIGLVVTPLNIILSCALFPFLGVSGVVVATVIAQLLAIIINLRSLSFPNYQFPRFS